MGRWTRDWLLPIVVGSVLLVGVVGLVWVFRLPLADRVSGFAALAIVVTVVGIVAPLLVQMERGRRPANSRPAKLLATLLAQAVYEQWRQEADQRRLVIPPPIPIRWSLRDWDVAGPVAAAVGTPDQLPAFPPLPGHTTITRENLRAGGARRELHQLFAGLASGRIVVVGAPGSGKSAAAILLLLDTLAHRDSLDGVERIRVPVPVLLTGHGWNPNTTSVQAWLRDRLVATYPLFQHRSGDAEAATLVAARDKVALIFDGLDEMDEALRPVALQALSDAPFRVVVLTRSQEMVQAASKAWLVGAIAVHLHDVTGPEATEYLQQARTGPPPASWSALLADLREHPEGVLARGLSTPLTLSLLRDTYQAGDDVGELLDTTRYSTAEHIERHLITRVLPAAYIHRPGRPPPRYSEAQARQALTFFARRMNQDHTRDLAWWHIPRWASTMPGIFTTGIKYGLLYGLAFGLALGLALGLASELSIELVAVTIVMGLMTGSMWGFMGAYTGKLASWRLTSRFKMIVEPRRIRIAANWRAFVSPQAVGQGLSVGLTGGLLLGLEAGLVFGLAGGVVLGLVYGFVFGLTEGGTGEGRPLNPPEIWHNDQVAGRLIGLGSGIVSGLLFALLHGLANGLIGFGSGLWVGLMMALLVPRTTFTTLAWRELKLSGHVPAVKLMPFLEDARDRGVLRTVGSVYQFRHATLQDQLADQTTPSSAVSQVS